MKQRKLTMRREAGRVGEERSEAGKGRGGWELAKGGDGGKLAEGVGERLKASRGAGLFI